MRAASMAATLRARQVAPSSAAVGSSTSAVGSASLALAVAASFHAQRRGAAGGAPAGTQHGGSRLVVDNAVPDESNTDFFELFRTSVQRRTVGNTSLRRFIRSCNEGNYARAVLAIEGAKAGGLRVDHDTYDAFLTLLLRSGQLKQALAAYNKMLEEKVTPHTKTFNMLIDLCADRQLADSAERIFNEMVRRGRQPDVESYEALMRAYSSEVPPKWEKAVAVFDKLQRNTTSISANTYNALMVVYMNMEPFDWRVVYNCYYEMRYNKPKILFGWNSYELVDSALKRGNAGNWRRLVTYVDAWIQLTVLWSFDFWFGVTVGFCILGIFRMLMGHVLHMSGAQILKESKNNPTTHAVAEGPM